MGTAHARSARRVYVVPVRLTKWYADCVTPDGALFIGYVAHLTLGPLRLDYTASIEADSPGAPVRQRQSLRRGRIEADAAGVRLFSPGLDVSGSWTGGVGTEPRRVLGTEGAEVTWQALRLAAHAEVTTPTRGYSGTGYAEVVRLTLPPWRLPLTDLDWGRFVADDASSAHTWTRMDGATVTEVTAPDGHATLDLGETRPIRVDSVPATLLGPFSGVLSRLLPATLRHLHEAKYLSRGQLVLDGTPHDGWVVHEEVRFG